MTLQATPRNGKDFYFLIPWH